MKICENPISGNFLKVKCAPEFPAKFPQLQMPAVEFDESRVPAQLKTQHLAAQRLGQQRWYEHYELRIAKVERAYSRPEGRG